MTDERTPEATENLGRYADDPRGDVGAFDLDGADAERIARAVEALEDAVALDPAQVAVALEGIASETPDLPPPDLPDDYIVDAEIGRGGMGVVYRAHQTSLDRTVAIKVLRPGELLFGQALKRFERETRAMARLRHPNIVAIHEVGETGGRVWFSMDMIEGSSMADLLADGRMLPAKAVRLMKQVASAVAYVHANGLVHRDLKPANILIDADGKAVVTDFGLALELGGGDDLTLTGQVLGTPAYMSPEQARGDATRVGEATDVYAMGAILYECLTGKRPFAHASPALQVWAVLKEDPVPPRRIERRVPEALERVCLQAMQKRPSARYPTARAFLEDLERFEEGRVVRAIPPSRAHRFGRWIQRRRVPLAWAAGALALAVAAFALVVVPRLKRDSTTLVAAGDALMRAKEPVGAARVYERALTLEGQASHDPALFDKWTRASVRAAETYWRRGQADVSIPILEHVLESGVAAYGTRGWARHEEVEWALATALALEGREGEADVLFEKAIDNWNQRIYRTTHDAFGDGRASRQIASHVAPWVGEDQAGLREAAVLQLRAVARHGYQGDQAILTLLEHEQGDVHPVQRTVFREHRDLAGGARGPAPRVRTVIEAVVADKPTPVMEWAFSQQLIFAMRRIASPAVEAALAEMASDSGVDRNARHAAAAVLADLADLPTVSGFLTPGTLAGVERAAEATVAFWRQVRGMERRGEETEAFWDRMDRAVETLERLEAQVEARSGPSAHAAASRAEASNAVLALRRWFHEHAGVPMSPASADWVGRHRGHDPQILLASALGWDAPPLAEDAALLLRRFATARENSPERAWIHHLLGRTVDSPRARPVWGLRWPGRKVLERWRALVEPGEGAGWWHVARYRFDGGLWARDPEADQARWLVPAQEVTLQMRRRLPRSRTVVVSVTPPGLRPLEQPASESTLSVSAQLVWTDRGQRIFVSRVQKEHRGPGWAAMSSTGGNSAGAEWVMSPDASLHSWSADDPFRNEITLSVKLADRDPTAPLTDEEWRARIAADLSRLAEVVQASREARYAEQDTIENLAAVAGRLSIPEGIDGMRRLQSEMEATRGLEAQADLLLLARLNAGDESLLDDAGLRRRLDAIRAGMNTLRVGRELFWIRLLATTRSDALRALALERLETEPMAKQAAGDLLDLARAGHVQLTPAIQARLARGPTEDRSFLGLLRSAGGWTWAAGVLWALAFLALLLVAWPGRPPWARLVPAAWLLALGFAFVALDLRVANWDVVPDTVGFLLALVGVWVLARKAPALRSLMTIWLALGALNAWALDAGALSGAAWGGGLVTFLAVLLLPTLAMHLRSVPRTERDGVRMPWGFAVLYAIPLAVAWTLAGIASVTAWSFDVPLGPVLGPLWFLGLGGCVLWALSAVLYGARVRKVWRRTQAKRGAA